MNHSRGFAWIAITILFGILALVGASYWIGAKTASAPAQLITEQGSTVATTTDTETQTTSSQNNNAPSATIDQSSLTTTLQSSTLTGGVSGTSHIHVQVGGSQGLSSDTGGVVIQNGHWSATFGPFSPGTYPVYVTDNLSQKVLASGTLVVHEYSGPQGLLQAPGSNSEAPGVQ